MCICAQDERRNYTMKKTAKLLVLALVVAALAAIFAIPSQAQAGPVLYISNAGTGDGKTPQTPMGHGEGYVPDDTEHYKDNVMIRALYQIGSTGGTIVIVGETTIDTCSSNTNVSGKTAAELDCITYEGRNSTDYNANPTVTITSNYGGVDYRTQGAKLVLDHAECCSANLRLKSPTVWKDLIIEYKYDPAWTSYYNNTAEGIIAPFMLLGDYCRITIDTGVETKSTKVEVAADGTKTETESDIYPAIVGGHRQTSRKMNTEVIVKSGTWEFVIAGGHGHNATNHAKVDGNAKVSIEGGKVERLYGTGSTSRAYGTVTGTVDISVTGGEVGDVWLTNGEIYTGPGITMTVTDPAKITGTIYHSPIDGEILPECTVTVNGQPYTPPTTTPEETTVPASTDKPATAPASKPTSNTTKTPTSTTAPATDDKKDEGSNLTLIIIIVVVAVVVIAAAVVVLLLIKKKKAAK